MLGAEDGLPIVDAWAEHDPRSWPGPALPVDGGGQPIPDRRHQLDRCLLDGRASRGPRASDSSGCSALGGSEPWGCG
jgi:hypothetical protein